MYHRDMGAWWRRDPYFMRYMAREATAVFVAAYALVLLAGIVSLALGESAYARWLEAMGSPVAIAFHAAVVAALAYHTLTWFEIMPKTMPPIVVAGHRVAARAITLGGIAAAALASLALYGLLASLR